MWVWAGVRGGDWRCHGMCAGSARVCFGRRGMRQGRRAILSRSFAFLVVACVPWRPQALGVARPPPLSLCTLCLLSRTQSGNTVVVFLLPCPTPAACLKALRCTIFAPTPSTSLANHECNPLLPNPNPSPSPSPLPPFSLPSPSPLPPPLPPAALWRPATLRVWLSCCRCCRCCHWVSEWVGGSLASTSLIGGSWGSVCVCVWGGVGSGW